MLRFIYFTFRSAGFFFFALALASRLVAARIAPADLLLTPSVRAILACTALNPGCAFILYPFIKHYKPPPAHPYRVSGRVVRLGEVMGNARLGRTVAPRILPRPINPCPVLVCSLSVAPPAFTRKYETPLSKLLDDRKISRRRLADASGINVVSIRYYCAGYRQIPYAHVKQIAACLSVPVESLIFNGRDYRETRSATRNK